VEGEVYLNYSVKSDLKLVQPTVAEIIGKLKRRVKKETLLTDLRLCLEEALINAIKHGNQQKRELEVNIEVKQRGRRVEFRVSDKGKGFDTTNIPDPTEKNNLQRPSGRGIFLIKKIMDEVRFFDGGRTIFMLKYLD